MAQRHINWPFQFPKMLEQFCWIYNFLCNTTIWCMNYVPSFILNNIHFCAPTFCKTGKGKQKRETILRKGGPKPTGPLAHLAKTGPAQPNSPSSPFPVHTGGLWQRSTGAMATDDAVAAIPHLPVVSPGG